MPTLEEMSGEKQASPRLALNEITINGQTGSFRMRDVKGGLIEGSDGKKRYAERDLGKEVEVVFLKIRRKLQAHQEGKRPLATNEHNAKTDLVTLFGHELGVQKGTAEQLRVQFPILKTVQVVYALYENELVRLFVRGSSLGSKSKPEGIADFYSYISGFKKNGRNDHFYECYTKLLSLQERGKLGPYFCMTYQEGDKLSADEMQVVQANMTIAYDFAKEVDAYYSGDKVTAKASESVLPTVEYPEDDEEDLNPEDIPF